MNSNSNDNDNDCCDYDYVYDYDDDDDDMYRNEKDMDELRAVSDSQTERDFTRGSRTSPRTKMSSSMAFLLVCCSFVAMILLVAPMSVSARYTPGGFGEGGLTSPPINQKVFNVLDYGAVGDGVTKDTAAVISAFQAADNNGGGVVYFPAGESLYHYQRELIPSSSVVSSSLSYI